jgi:predicted NBD/HSP70 family sugar kinase
MANRQSARTDVNRSAILAQLGAQGPASRADLARLLGVSPALMTQLVKELLAAGLVIELDHSPSQGGRPARMLGLATTGDRVIGVKVVADHVAFVEVGLDGSVQRSASEPFDAAASTVLADLARLLERFIAGGTTRLLGVGVGVPGSVDRQGNGVVDSPQLGWNQVPLGASLRRELGLPVLVENNVNALAMAERLYGVGRRHGSFLVVTIGTGVGAGIVVDGVVLESIIGEAALVRTARERGAIPESGGIAALRAAADAGDSVATAVFSEAGHLLGRTLAGLVHALDPEIVILLGEGTASWPHWSFGFEPAFRSSLLPARRGVGVAVETWQDESWAQGAAALVLATPFDSEGVSGEQGQLVRDRLSTGHQPPAGMPA